MDRKASAMVAYGLGFLAALRHLQWPTDGSDARLPAGGPNCVCDDSSQDSLIATCHIPEEPTSRLKRPVCVVFDESDPISALERSFDFSSASTSAGTQTIFVEHRSTQTEGNEFASTEKRMTDESTQYNEESKPAKVKKKKVAYPAPPYYQKEITELSQDALTTAKQQNMLQKMQFWRRSLIQTPKAENQMPESSHAAAKQEKNVDSVEKMIPAIYDKLNELVQKVDKHDRDVKQLQLTVDSIKQRDDNNDGPSFAESSIFAQKKSPFQQPMYKKRMSDDSEWTTSNSKTSSPAKTPLSSIKEANVSAKKPSSKVEFATDSQPSSSYILQKQFSSECQFCVEQLQPVLDDVMPKVLKLIGRRKFEDVMITVLLRSDNVYHVNVQEKQSKLNLGCLLATHEAIERAAKQGFFSQFLTYTVTDVRNTITPPTRPFGIPFEFVSPETSTKSKACDEEHSQSSNNAICEFITKVLRMPIEKSI